MSKTPDMAEIVYVPKPPHACVLPSPASTDPKIRPGTIVHCKTCAAYYQFVGPAPVPRRPLPARWQRLLPATVAWRIILGQLPPALADLGEPAEKESNHG